MFLHLARHGYRHSFVAIPATLLLQLSSAQAQDEPVAPIAPNTAPAEPAPAPATPPAAEFPPPPEAEPEPEIGTDELPAERAAPVEPEADPQTDARKTTEPEIATAPPAIEPAAGPSAVEPQAAPPAPAENEEPLESPPAESALSVGSNGDIEYAEPPAPYREPTPFDQGRVSIGGGLSWASTENTNWTILGLYAGVYVFNGVGVETDSSFWLGGDPFIATVSPGLRYVLWMVPTVKPYVGTFYRRYFISGGKDANAVGARGGVYFLLGGGSSVGGGLAYEHIIEDDVFAEQDQIYPELAFTFSF